jgi:hypothetical protein
MLNVRGQLHTSADLPASQEIPIPFNGMLGGNGADLSVFGKEINFFYLPEIETYILQPVAGSLNRLGYCGSSVSPRANLIPLCHLNVNLPKTLSF